MKQFQSKRLLIAGIALLTVPFSLFAQKQDDKVKEKVKDKQETQQITIIRTGDKNEKVVIEVNGDKVLVNGKDAKADGNTRVRVNTFTNGSRTFATTAPGRWSATMNGDEMSLFSEDENRAMLGVVTEGDDRGAEIRSVTKESGADKAGLKKGDIITRIGDTKIETTDDVTEAVHARKPGDKVSITFLRDGKEQKVTAELSKWKGIQLGAVTMPTIAPFQTYESIEGPRISGFGMNRPRLGLSVQDTDDGKGVKVLEVEEESNAAKAGLKENDVILSIDEQEIHGTDDVVKATRTQKDKYNYSFKINRNGKTETIQVNVPRRLKTADL